ncbi:MAG: FCD domain-containing protein [Lacisediminihabitans sp.]
MTMVVHSDSSREWVTVLEGLEARLLAGDLKAGFRLPSERALASRLKVRRASVREALRVLEVLDIINTKSGSRFGSAGILVASPAGGMGTLMRLQVAARGFRVSDIVHTRVLLECAVAKNLAENHSSIDLAPLLKQIEAMDDARHSASDYVTLNAKFHAALAEASGNHIVTSVMAGLRHSIESATYEGAGGIPDWPATVTRLQKEHRELLDAIAEGDGPRAAAITKAHISGYYVETHLAPGVA